MSAMQVIAVFAWNAARDVWLIKTREPRIRWMVAKNVLRGQPTMYRMGRPGFTHTMIVECHFGGRGER